MCLPEFSVYGVCMRGYVYLSLCVRKYMNVCKSILGTAVYVSVYTCVSRQEHARVCRATGMNVCVCVCVCVCVYGACVHTTV